MSPIEESSEDSDFFKILEEHKDEMSNHKLDLETLHEQLADMHAQLEQKKEEHSTLLEMHQRNQEDFAFLHESLHKKDLRIKELEHHIKNNMKHI